MKLSVIIPVYNAEAYLEKCVESVLAFPMEKEVILVDDGSRDRSPRICDQFQSSYHSEIKLIHQENKGVSAARNAGLEIATGDYVWFVDSDDTVISSLSAKLMFEQSKFQVKQVSEATPLVVFGFVWDENGVANTFGASADEVPYNLWRCWFDRKSIEENKIRFTEGRKYAEDQEFILKFLVSAHGSSRIGTNIVSAINEPLYYYTLRPGSAMTKKGVKGKKIKDIAAVLFGFAWNALVSGLMSKKWVWRELKRMAKTLYITIIRK